MEHLANNLKIILLKQKIKPDRWLEYLATFFAGGEVSARLLLLGQLVEDHQGIDNLQGAIRRSLSVLMTEDLSESLDSKEILILNLFYLLETLDHGLKKQLALHVGVDQTTISKWLKEIQSPNSNNLKKIIEFVSLPPDTDLKSELLFLEDVPVGVFQTRRWLHERIEGLDGDELRELVPALKKLFD